MAHVARRHRDMLDRRRAPRTARRPLRSRPARRGRPPRARRRRAARPPRRGRARSTASAVVVAVGVHQGVGQLAPERDLAAAPPPAPRSKLAVKRVALAAQPAQPRQRGMALRSSRDAGGAAPRARRSPSSSPALGELRGGPAEQDRRVVGRERERPLEQGDRGQARPPSPRAPRLCAISGVVGRQRGRLGRAPRPPAPDRRAGGGRGRAPATCAASPGWRSAPARASGSASAASPCLTAVAAARNTGSAFARVGGLRAGRAGVGGHRPSSGVVRIGRGHHRRHRRRARRREIGMPGVDDQDDAQRVARDSAPHARSCRRRSRPCPPPSRGVSAPTRNQQPVGHDQRQMADQPGIGDAGMRRDMRARREQREHRIGPAAAGCPAGRVRRAAPSPPGSGGHWRRSSPPFWTRWIAVQSRLRLSAAHCRSGTSSGYWI